MNTEHQAQKSLLLWWGFACKQWQIQESALFAIPNGGRRDAITGARLKKEGVRPGVPDLFLAVPRGKQHGLFIEMKKDGGRVSPEQREYIEMLARHGYSATVCVGSSAAIFEVEKYLRQK